jgi:hypothetical protein
VGDHVGILGVVVFAFCCIGEARVDKPPLSAVRCLFAFAVM